MPEPHADGVAVYCDYAATTPVHPEVLEAMAPYFHGGFGNPSSAHHFGRRARAALEDARARLAAALEAEPDEIVFTGGGTEADNLAILGVSRGLARAGARPFVCCSPLEHKAVLAAVERAAAAGARTALLPLRPTGVVDLAGFDALAPSAPGLCSLMWVNNEVGTLQPVPALVARCRARGLLCHTDAVQAFGKLPISVRQTPVDLLSLSGHKIGAPKGVGALYLRRGTPIEPMVVGGGQESGLRPGTENVAFAIGLARAAELALADRDREQARLGELRDGFEAALRACCPEVQVHGAAGDRVPYISSLALPNPSGQSPTVLLDQLGVACSAGSACSARSPKPSHVLTAMGVSTEVARNTVRVSFGRETTSAHVDRLVAAMIDVIAQLRDAPAPFTGDWNQVEPESREVLAR